jgi:uncharacterized Zn-finger protein
VHEWFSVKKEGLLGALIFPGKYPAVVDQRGHRLDCQGHTMGERFNHPHVLP